MPDVNPYVRLEWDEVVPGDGETFVAYHVYRDGTLIASIPSIGTTSYDDYLAPPGPCTYEVCWLADISGAEIESERVTLTPDLEFRHGWLHDVGDPSHAVQVLATRVHRSRSQGLSYRRAGGLSAPTPFVTKARARRWRIDLIPEAITDGATWAAIEALQDRQETHAAVLCLRLGFRDGERAFVMLEEPEGGFEANLERTSFVAQEVAFEESVP